MARNESLFREVNERIAEVSRSHRLADHLEFLCECGRGECLQAISVLRADYERVRSQPDRFLLVRGHEDAEFEHVVVVEKQGEAGATAEQLDPRSQP